MAVYVPLYYMLKEKKRRKKRGWKRMKKEKGGEGPTPSSISFFVLYISCAGKREKREGKNGKKR